MKEKIRINPEEAKKHYNKCGIVVLEGIFTEDGDFDYGDHNKIYNWQLIYASSIDVITDPMTKEPEEMWTIATFVSGPDKLDWLRVDLNSEEHYWHRPGHMNNSWENLYEEYGNPVSIRLGVSK